MINIGFLKSVEVIREGKELIAYNVEFEKRKRGPLPALPEKKEEYVANDQSVCDEELPF
ncbi:hypothetical protein D9M71_804570 [compost metagenome]